MRIGFAIASHRNVDELVALLEELNSAISEPALAIHHDFSQAELNKKLLPTNAALVEAWKPTAWGQWSLVEAEIAALRLSWHMEPACEWFYLISPPDLLCIKEEELIEELRESVYDAYIHHERIAEGLELRPWHQTCKVRYKQETAHWPYCAQYQCYAGDQWFTANRRAVKTILKAHDQHCLLRQHLLWCSEQSEVPIIPDECYFATILRNAKNLAVSSNNLRYIDWQTHNGCNPKLLSNEDAANIRAAGAHIARKADPEQRKPLHEQLLRYSDR